MYTLVSDDSDYTSDVSYPMNSQANVNYPLPSMSQTNANTTVNETNSTVVVKKSIPFVQPVIRDANRRTNFEQKEKAESNSQQEPLSYVSRPKPISNKFISDQQ